MEKPSLWTDGVFSKTSQDLLMGIATHLWHWDIEHDSGGREIEKFVPVSQQAKINFVEWFNAIAVESFLAENKGLLEKLKAKALRICLLLHCLDAALAGGDGMSLVTGNCMRRALLLAEWAKGHQEQCWRFFQPEKGTKQADPIERAIMQVVVDEASRIETAGWKISNAKLFSLVGKKLGMPELSSVKIGKIASGLGLPVCWVTSSDKGRTVTRERILSFRTTVGSVGSVGNLTTAMVSREETPVGNPLVSVGKELPERGQPTEPTVPQHYPLA
jgi:hypothetical protein